MKIRPYKPEDYADIINLYKDTEMSGSEFDVNRDGKEKLDRRIANDSASILLAEDNGRLVGSVSLVEDGRVAWLFRFRVREDITNESEVATELYESAKKALIERGHHQVLVYTTVEEEKFKKRYKDLGFSQGHDYACFWKDI